jgi:hypothetical protein
LGIGIDAVRQHIIHISLGLSVHNAQQEQQCD